MRKCGAFSFAAARRYFVNECSFVCCKCLCRVSAATASELSEPSPHYSIGPHRSQRSYALSVPVTIGPAYPRKTVQRFYFLLYLIVSRG